MRQLINIPMTARPLLAITKDVQEVIGLDEIEERSQSGKQQTAYWGVEPNQEPDLRLVLPLLKLRDLVHADLDVVVFLADVHAFLNRGLHWLDGIDRSLARINWYKLVITAVMRRLGVKSSDFRFVLGSDLQLERRYTLDLYKFMTIATVSQAKKASATVMKQEKDPKVSSVCYSMLQVLDQTAVGASIEVGTIEQRGIYQFARETAFELGYEQCAYLMHAKLPSLSKPGAAPLYIGLTDSKVKIAEQVKRAFCVHRDCNLEWSPCLSMLKLICFPVLERVGTFESFDDLIAAWSEGGISVVELKDLLVDSLDEVLDSVREELLLETNAYFQAYQ